MPPKTDQPTPGHPDGEENAAKSGTESVPETPGGESVEEIGGPKGPEPTRFGDWERAGRCSDF